jgi:hypothetical protein
MRASCQNNLKQIGDAFRTWADDHDDEYPMSVSITNGGSMEWRAGGNMLKHFQVMSNELNNPKVLLCPSDDRGLPRDDDFADLSNENISYYVGLDADAMFPTLWLAGDRNLVTNGEDVVPGLADITTSMTAGWSAKMHDGEGNLLLADGSVQQVASRELKGFAQRSGTNLIRLAVP